MKTLKLLLLFSFCIFSLQAQQITESPNQHFSSFDADLGWVKLKAEKSYSAAQFFDRTYSAFGLQQAEDMQLYHHQVDQYGWTHYRYHQYYRQIRVEGGTYLLHEQNGKVSKANGNIIPDIKLNTTAGLKAEAAIQLALRYHPAEQYKWQNEAAEAQIRSIKKDVYASHYPNPALVIVDPAYPQKSSQLVLAYKMIIYTEKPLGRYLCWIDAQSGQLLNSYNLLHTSSVEGTAVTRYHGEQTIYTSQNSQGEYVLRDTSRGEGITTLDLSDEYNPQDFTDDDNYWNNVNAQQDEVATDAHFGATATYDFFLDNFGYDSYDGQGSELVSNVHFGTDYNNAFWDGSSMTYGDGDGINFGPFTAIDVCGHEVAHGVTEYTSNLVYANEPGALNESFSDIFGKTIEFLYAPEGASWLLGERMLLDSTALFRSMSNPNDTEHPRYYKGVHWYNESGDNGGVHSNSGVQNYWYYLLCTGFDGINEAGQNVVVPAIGMNKAMHIAFRNNSAYLTEESLYVDARRGSLEAAADLYGFCSEEYLAVAAAWHAVGVGYSIQDHDYEVQFEILQEDGCDISEVGVSMQLFNNGCMVSLPAGTKIPVFYQLDTLAPVSDTLELIQDLAPAETAAYTFSQNSAVAGFGDHNIKTWAVLPGDVNAENNTNEYTFLNRVYQNEEFAVTSVFPSFGFCDEDPEKSVFAFVQYQGCDILPSGAMIPYNLAFKDFYVEDEQRNFRDREPFENVFIFDDVVFNDYGFGTGTITVNYPDDPTADNNSGSFYLAYLQQSEVGWIEPFDLNTMDSTHIAVQVRFSTVNSIQEVAGDGRLLLSGSSILDDQGELLVEIDYDPLAFFQKNFQYHTILNLCLDLRGMLEPYLSFDLAQTHSNTDYGFYGINPDFSTMLGIYVDGQRIDTLIHGDLGSPDFQNYEFDLSAYVDTTHELQIRALALTASGIPGQLLLDGDNNIIDNIQLADRSTATTNPELAGQIQIFPNPSTGTFQLSRKDKRSFQNAVIEIYDAAGRLIGGKQLGYNSASISFGAELLPGIYLVKLTDEQRSVFSKVVKQ